MKSLLLCTCLVSCGAAVAQQAPSFEVASIKPAQQSSTDRIMIRMSADAGMLRYTNVSLKDCIRVAYKVKDFQVQGPDWLGSARFDIVAKLPDGVSQDQIPEMLVALLAERFKLTVHRESKEHAVYALVAAKGGPKLKPAEEPKPDAAPPADGSRPSGGPPRGAMMMMMDPGGMHLKASSVTLPGLAEAISRFCERPVVDKTGIAGQYDFELVFAPETTRGMRALGEGHMPPPGDGPPRGESEAPVEKAGTIYEAVQRYGLKLEPRKDNLDILTIDHIEKEPTAN